MAIRVLWLSRHMPLPANAGDVNYSRLLACSLALAGAEVTFMGLASEETNLSAYQREGPGIAWKPINAKPKAALLSVLSSLPLQTARYAIAPFKAALRAELTCREYHCVVLDFYAMGWALDALRGQPACLVYVSHNFETETTAAIARNFKGNLLKKLFLRANAWKACRIERRLTEKVDLLAVNTDEDRLLYVNLKPKQPPITLRPGYSGRKRAMRDITNRVPRRVVILGSFQWIAKQMNLERFLQAADQVFADAGIEIQVVGLVGKDLRDRWKGRLRATRFIGFVDDLAACLDQARMGLVVETTGGGFKHKTLDYVFGRLPVAALAASLGGIDGDIKQNFIIEQEAESLAKSVRDAIGDFGRLNAMQDGAFKAAATKFEWDSNGRHLMAGIVSTLEDKSG